MKYILTDEKIKFDNHILYRIKYLKDDSLGGWIESQKNLSQEGECRVLDNAKVYHAGYIEGNAVIRGKAIVRGKAWVYDNAVISDRVIISGRCSVHGYVQISGKTIVYGDMNLNGDFHIGGKGFVEDFISPEGRPLTISEQLKEIRIQKIKSFFLRFLNIQMEEIYE